MRAAARIALTLVLCLSTSTPADAVSDPALHARYVQRAATERIDTLFIGDSITDGWTRSSVWPIYERHLHAAAFGISGSPTAEILWRLQNGELARARTYVVLAGAPDLKGLGRTQDETAAGVLAIVDYIRQQRPDAHIVLVATLPLLDFELGSLTRSLAARADDHVRVLDVSGVFRRGDAIDRVLMPDEIHPSNLGYVMWSIELLPVLWAAR